LLGGCTRAEDEPRVAASAIVSAPSHLLVTLELSPSGLRVLDTKTVPTALPRLRVPEVNRWHLSFRDSAGQLLHQIDLAPADELRGEFQSSDGGPTEAHFARKTTSVFVARLPSAAGTLRLSTDSTQLGAVAISPPTRQ